MIRMTIDDRTYAVDKEMSVLEVARAHDIPIPVLCYHPALKPSGSCRLCGVEVAGTAIGRPRIMLSCLLKAKDGLRVRTRGEMVETARTRAFENLLRMAPQSRRIRDLASAWGCDPGMTADGCIRCRLCERVCKEVVGPGALKMEKRGGVGYVVPNQGACIGCGTCVNICPTEAIRLSDEDNVRTISIRDEIIGRHPLEKCEGCGKMFATPRFLDHIRMRTGTHTDVKAHHRYCPVCAKLFSERIESQQRHLRK